LHAPVIKAHGSSDANAVFSAIKQAVNMVENNVSSTIQKAIEQTANEEKER
jgi:glycerol-3-phosphate acyltransferase PlsX